MISKSQSINFGNARFTVYFPGVIRLEYQRNKLFPKTPSIITAAKLPKPLSADVKKSRRILSISTDKFNLTFEDNGKEFDRDNLKIEHPYQKQKAVWKPGDSGQPLVEMVRSLDVWPEHEHFERQEHYGVLNRTGCTCIIDEAQVYRTKDNEWAEVTPYDQRGQDWWFFGYGYDYIGALQNFVNIFGKIPLVPRWVFGFWYSKWFEYTDNDIVKIAKKYRNAGLPMDVMVIDTEWRKEGWRGYNWHPSRFKNYKSMMKQLKKMGLIVSLNDHPGYNTSDALPSDDKFIPLLKRELNEPPLRGQWACDWSSNKCTEMWKSLVLSKQFKDGMDFWWIDGWAEAPFHKIKGQFWLNRHYYETAEKANGKRGMILSRWGGWGSHRFPVQFSGDTRSNWETLKHQIKFTADSSGAGACYWSHDIGGFHDNKIDDELYIRWIQFGAFSPVFRTHSAYGSREPFEYSKLAQKVFKQVVRQRYAMVPYYYQLAREAYDTGLPICRPMYLHYPNIYQTYSNPFQYQLGKDILVVPAFMSGKITFRTFWVPDGTWVRPQTGEILRGYGEQKIEIPLNDIPVFYRLGSIIPHQEPAEYTRQKPLDPLYLDIYPNPHKKTVFDFYEDDGESKNFEKNEFSRTKITCIKTINEICIKVEKPRGKFKGQLKNRIFDFNIWLAPEDNVKNIFVNDNRLPKNGWCKTKTYAAGTCKGKTYFINVKCNIDQKNITLKVV